MASIERAPGWVPVGNPEFVAAPVGFNALVAWNARELASVSDDDELTAIAETIAAALTERWDAERLTWIDAGAHADGSGRVRTADALLPLLVEERAEVVDAVAGALTDGEGLGGPFGPRGVDRREPTYSPRSYWRGPAWPQLTYLLWRAARQHEHRALTETLAASLVRGAERSGFAEAWDADDATPHGAVPQSWAALALVVAAALPTDTSLIQPIDA
jgi:glycogen debranching enzyme